MAAYSLSAIIQLLNPDNTISAHRMLAHAIGMTETIIYSALISKQTYYSQNGMLLEGGWFFSTVYDLQESTTFGTKAQKTAIKHLIEYGLIECENKLNDDSKEKDLFERLCDIFPDILTGNRKSVQFEALEDIHTVELNGDLLTLTKDDGNVVTETAMKIDYKNEKAIPYSLDGMVLSTEIEEKNAYFANINSFFDKLEDNGITEIEQDVQTDRDNISI